MADRVLVMSAHPCRVIAEVKIDIARPRTDFARSLIFFEHVDCIEAMLLRAFKNGKIHVVPMGSTG